MSTERRKILDMLKEGKITAEDADRLIDKLEQLDQREPVTDEDVIVDPGIGDTISAAVATAMRGAKAAATKAGRAARTLTIRATAGEGKPRWFCIQVNTADGDNINVRLPLKLLQAGVRLAALLPENAREAIEEQGIDLDKLGELDADKLVEALQEIDINVNTGDGDTIRICCE